MADELPLQGAERNRRSKTTTVAAVLVSIGSLSGSAYLAIDGELLAGLMRALTGPRSGTGAAIPTAGPAICR